MSRGLKVPRFMGRFYARFCELNLLVIKGGYKMPTQARVMLTITLWYVPVNGGGSIPPVIATTTQWH